MSGPRDQALDLEPERYELASDWALDLELTRRDLLRAVGGGLLVLALFRDPEATAFQPESGGRRRGGGGDDQAPREIGAWVHIGEDGAVTAYTGKAEVGQDIRTSLAQAVADELRVSLESVSMVMADTDRVPYDRGTFGSRTTPTMAVQLRRASAAAREALIDLAAERWEVDRSGLRAADGKVLASGQGDREASFGELTRGQELLKAIDDDAPITPADRWEVAGRSASKLQGLETVTGRRKFSSDVKRPGMRFGKVARPEVPGAALRTADTAAAKAIPGVTVVRDGDFLGVVAADEPTATRAVAAIKAEWSESEPGPSHEDLFDALRRRPADEQRPGGPSRRETGSIKEGLAGADLTLERSYTVAYIAHAPLEPRAAVAEWAGDRLTVWTGTQRPFGVRSELARAFNLPEDRVRVIVPDTGAGYGGKHTGEAALEAARLARESGTPVKLAWTRPEEFTHAYFRPAGLIEATAGARRDGRLTAWDFQNVNSGASGLETPYEVANRRVAFREAKSPLRQGSYRALASTANHFARESLMDELARGLDIDPLAFRLKNLEDDRLRAVLEAAAERFGWGEAKPGSDRGFGLACGTEKGGFVATCVEVAADLEAGTLKVVRAATAFECGAIVNPDHLANQVEGAVIMGLGGALFEAIRFEGGRILNARFARYRVPRFGDVPKLETVLLDRKDLPSAGAGEAPIIAIAPAIANALADATGLRIRSMPMVPDGLKPA